ncbi:hypothetical protein BGZ83_002594 [Gryganskiella cystojenkinii]|nr:hypothetical protein BGZ83_002594 [Gryganskiella cystojenkinii]
MEKVLELPEIIGSIGNYCDLGSLTSAVRVSKFWHKCLIAKIYYYMHTFAIRPQPSTETMAKYGRYIKYLNCDMRIDEDDEDPPEQQEVQQRRPSFLTLYTARSSRCNNLLDLILNFVDCRDPNELCRAVLLIMMNPKLLRLEISGQGPTPPQPCWIPLFASVNRELQEITLKHVNLSTQDTDQLLELGPSLVKLHLAYGRIRWSNNFNAIPQFPQVKDLWLEKPFDSSETDLEWMKQCPALESLSWNVSGGFVFGLGRTTLRTALRDFQWSNLQSLSVSSPSSPLTDAEVAILLNACRRPLRVLGLPGSKFWYRSLDALERHFVSLESLSLLHTKTYSWMIQKILTSCPRLQNFTADVLEAHDLVQSSEAKEARSRQVQIDAESDTERTQQEVQSGVDDDPERLQHLKERFAAERDPLQVRPWACSDLERLKVFIRFDISRHKTWDRQVFAQLGELQYLLDLDVGVNLDEPVAEVRGLWFDLESGLGQMENVVVLESLYFYTFNQHMEEKDIRWVLAVWFNLRCLTSEFNTDMKTRFRLQQIVREYSGDEIYMINASPSPPSD